MEYAYDNLSFGEVLDSNLMHQTISFPGIAKLARFPADAFLGAGATDLGN